MKKALIVGVAAAGVLFTVPALADSTDMDCENGMRMIMRNQQDPAEIGRSPMNFCAEDFDQDNDGRLDADEWTTVTDAWRAEFDADDDDYITMQEFRDRLDSERTQ